MTTANDTGGRYTVPNPDAARDLAVARLRYALAEEVYRANRETVRRERGKRFAGAYAYGRALQIIIAAFGAPAATPDQIAGELPLPSGARKEAWDFIGVLGAPAMLGKDWLA